MHPHLLGATYVDNYRIALIFSDGIKGVVDFSDELEGALFEPLREVEYFKRFRLNPDTKTVEWPNEADFAPDFLCKKLQRAKDRP